jgi:hypothetical protein
VFNRFDHYLSYGSTDQETVRKLTNYFNGLLIPGTIAAFQSEGTRGFVLTLTARSREPYVIDPRFPLFQNRLIKPKKSHLMLATILGVPDLVNTSRIPLPGDLNPTQIETIAHRWIDFNIGFEDVKTKTFAKYADRLNESVLPEAKQTPAYILPPYAMVDNPSDGWWELSKKLWDESQQYALEKGVEHKLRRVVATNDPTHWNSLAGAIQDKEIVGWVSNLSELELSSEVPLINYGEALMKARQRNQQVFALYGGFFSVLLSRYGLTGASHGIGFGEHRDSIELPSSGAPPARYYVPLLHRYIGVEIAVHLWRQFPELISCDCDECHGGSPSDLLYHQLMSHSVRVRSKEIADWLDLPTSEVVMKLTDSSLDFRKAVAGLNAPPKVVDGAQGIYQHLAMWARVIKHLG